MYTGCYQHVFAPAIAVLCAFLDRHCRINASRNDIIMTDPIFKLMTKNIKVFFFFSQACVAAIMQEIWRKLFSTKAESGSASHGCTVSVLIVI